MRGMFKQWFVRRYFIIVSVLGFIILLSHCTTGEERAKKHYNSGWSYLTRGFYHEAYEEFQKAIDADREFGPAYYQLGKLQFNLDGFTIEPDKQAGIVKAIDLFKKAITFLPESNLPLVALGDVYYGQDKLDDAIAMYTRAIQLDENSKQSHYMMALCYWKKGQLEMAIPHCDRVKELGYDPPMGRRVGLYHMDFKGKSVCDLLK